MVEEIIEDVIDTIDVARPEQIAGLLSGSYSMYLTGDYEVVILLPDADDDGAFRQVYGHMYDLAINGMDSYNDDGGGYKILAEAVKIVGIPDDEYDDLEDLEDDGVADTIRAKALDASAEFMLRQRLYLKSLVNKSFIKQVCQEILEDDERNSNDGDDF